MKKKLLLLPLLALCSCGGNNEPDVKPVDVVDTIIVLKFYEDYSQDLYTLITWKTEEYLFDYYLTNCYYRIDFDNNIYTTKYLSAFNDIGELIAKEITK